MRTLTYIDGPSAVGERNGMITIDFPSGGETISLIVTRHAAAILKLRLARQLACLDAALDQTVATFPVATKRKKRGVRNA